MSKWFLSIALLLSVWSVQAHQTEISSTMLVEQEDNKWILQVRSALTAFDHIIKVNYPPDSFKSAEEFQALVLAHLKENIQVTFNEDEVVTLQNGGVKLGHETIAVFEVVGVPKEIQSVYVKNSGFETISRNQNTLVVLKKGFEKNRFTLNKKNAHALHLQIVDKKFVPVSGSKVAAAEITPDYAYIGVGISILGVLGLAFFTVRQFQ